MMAMDYGATGGTRAHQYSSSSMSSETMSGSCGSRANRIRAVRLVRPSTNLPPPSLTCRHGPSLGFSVRGGREHGTGFYVSHVEPSSEAHRQGLCVGDQIVRVNGFAVDDAVHKEFLQLISNHTHLTLKVRSVGMIPVKDKKSETLSWQIVNDGGLSRCSPPLMSDKIHDVRINIAVGNRSKLGCGICKGPDWKPGIFVQFTKEGGIAREAGLRPGDQILSCNNVDFGDIAFNEAVNLMKSSRQLEMMVRKSVGCDLFPGESSGYNSSASSVTGDQSPSWSDSKRLSIVKEESSAASATASRRRNVSSCHQWNDDEDADDDADDDDDDDDVATTIGLQPITHQNNASNNRIDIEYRNHDVISSQKRTPLGTNSKNGPIYQPTIINLTDNGNVTIRNNCSLNDFGGFAETGGTGLGQATRSERRLSSGVNPSNNVRETKTVVVEVHRSGDEKEVTQFNVPTLIKSPSSSSFASLASNSTTSSSLSSAICMEIQRRSEKMGAENTKKPSIDEQIQMKKILKNVTSEKQQQQHCKLMDEFKRAHQKMFKTCTNEANSSTCTEEKSAENLEASDRIADQELKEKLSERLLAATQSNVTSHTNAIGDAVAAAPPPPPPPPQLNGVKTKSKVVSTPTTANTTVIKKAVIPPTPPPPPTKNNPPPCPTPDYDSLSICSSTNGGNTVYSKTSTKCVKNDECDNGRIVPRNTDPNESVDMESLESFKLNNPARGHPKPPDIYFNGQQQQLRHQQACHGSRNLLKEGAHFVSKNTVKPQTATNIPPLATPPKPQTVSQYSTVRRTPAVNGHHRPVSITIGEYPTGTNRLRPGRLEFLHTSNVPSSASSSIQCDQNSSASSSGTESGTPCTSKSNSVTSQFASELAQTLNRSNLRKRTESLSNSYQ